MLRIPFRFGFCPMGLIGRSGGPVLKVQVKMKVQQRVWTGLQTKDLTAWFTQTIVDNPNFI